MALVFTLPEKSQKIEIEIMTLDPHGLKKSVFFRKAYSPKWGITQNLGPFNNYVRRCICVLSAEIKSLSLSVFEFATRSSKCPKVGPRDKIRKWLTRFAALSYQ